MQSSSDTLYWNDCIEKAQTHLRSACHTALLAFRRSTCSHTRETLRIHTPRFSHTLRLTHTSDTSDSHAHDSHAHTAGRERERAERLRIHTLRFTRTRFTHGFTQTQTAGREREIETSDSHREIHTHRRHSHTSNKTSIHTRIHTRTDS